ncbi:hypothetical protein N825_28230 [Skermanella stibiiresistens SB22]|uniref:Uncharacterized protein n=2 Tax=Skermanella TaxID=204447 RepID=W9H5L1_9PROT|nr:hypothetical protein N825_28230 [Skermanella stibiiresistens SB22]
MEEIKGDGGGGSQQSADFGDVLSRLQAKSSATGQPVPLPLAEAHGRALSTPAAGLLNCAAGMRPSHVDGRIECR